MVRTNWLILSAMALFTVPLFTILPLPAMETEAVSTGYRSLVPQVLLPLLHAPEVQQELKLSDSQITQLEQFFAKADGPWFRARILPAEEQSQVIAKLETLTHSWLSQHASAQQQQRLQQLEYQAQSVRSLLRTDVATAIDLADDQQQQLAQLAQDSDAAQKKLNAARTSGEAIEELESAATQAVKDERNALIKILKPDQLQTFTKLVGELFDTENLKRIYPMAPEFVPVEHWLNSPPLTMQAVRGQVVLVHFYAFECHNCHANFDVYQRWHKELTDQGVVVIGIQTPETAHERDPEAVKSAAQQRELEFPILIDLESKNWQAYGNTMWPTVYVIDKQGYIRHWWQGELRWKGTDGDKTIEAIVQQLLKEDS